MSDVVAADICVIGGGAAGLRVAASAAASGVAVALVERNLLGGGRADLASLRAQALIAAARHMRRARDGVDFGITVSGVEADFPAVMGHVREVVAAVEPNESPERLTGLGVTVIHGPARFRDRRTILVGSAEISARRFVVATGSRPRVPTIPGLDAIGHLTGDTIFDLSRRPTHLVIVGAGATGLELAQAFRRLGSAVTVLDAGGALAGDDPELRALLLETLAREGVDIRENVEIAKVSRRGRTGIRVSVTGADGSAGSIDGSHILLAAGRRPDHDNLDLAAGGIAFDASGIKVDGRLRTTNPHVYAIGDVTGGPPFSHFAACQAEFVVRDILFRHGGRIDQDLIAWTTFTDPELAHVGLSEAAARARHRHIEVLRWPFCENDRAQAERATRGLVKIVAMRRGRILGADILGRNAGELIAPLALAIAHGIDVGGLAGAMFPYPTFSEAARRAALSFQGPPLVSAWRRRAIRLLRKLG